jgi:hypothetical protein
VKLPRALAVVTVVALLGVVTETIAAAPDRASSAPASAAKKKKKRFKDYFAFRLVGDGCLPGDSTGGGKPRMILFGATPADPRHPLAPNGRVSVGRSIAVCLPGFNASRPLTVTIAMPNGRTEQRELIPDPVFALHGFTWQAGPELPRGRYELRADQGRKGARGTLEVERARFPLIDAGRGGVRLGESLHVVFAGFRPGERVRVGLYRGRIRRCPGQRRLPRDSIAYCFTHHVFSVTTDAEGELSADVPVDRPTYRAGPYALMALAPSSRRVVYGPRFDACSATADECGFDQTLLP